MENKKLDITINPECIVASNENVGCMGIISYNLMESELLIVINTAIAYSDESFSQEEVMKEMVHALIKNEYSNIKQGYTIRIVCSNLIDTEEDAISFFESLGVGFLNIDDYTNPTGINNDFADAVLLKLINV